MKKRLLALTLVFVMLFSFASCGASVGKYEYTGLTTSAGYTELRDSLDFVYEETFLNLKEDGTWSIDFPIILFISSKIDKGTYTVEEGVYTFEGFEYGMDAYGVETDNGFDIYFMDPLDDSNIAVTLRFKK